MSIVGLIVDKLPLFQAVVWRLGYVWWPGSLRHMWITGRRESNEYCGMSLIDLNIYIVFPCKYILITTMRQSQDLLIFTMVVLILETRHISTEITPQEVYFCVLFTINPSISPWEDQKKMFTFEWIKHYLHQILTSSCSMFCECEIIS